MILHDDMKKIAATNSMILQFDLTKVASEEELIEKLAQIELAHRRGEITDLEKEAGIAAAGRLLRGLGGAARMGARSLSGMKGIGGAASRAYGQAMNQGLGRGRALLAGASGGLSQARLGLAGAGGLQGVGRAMKGGWQQGVARAAAPASRFHTALGAGALGLGVGAGGMAMMGSRDQPQQRYR